VDTLGHYWRSNIVHVVLLEDSYSVCLSIIRTVAVLIPMSAPHPSMQSRVLSQKINTGRTRTFPPHYSLPPRPNRDNQGRPCRPTWGGPVTLALWLFVAAAHRLIPQLTNTTHHPFFFITLFVSFPSILTPLPVLRYPRNFSYPRNATIRCYLSHLCYLSTPEAVVRISTHEHCMPFRLVIKTSVSCTSARIFKNSGHPLVSSSRLFSLSTC
jgi:hypothetical protein